MTAGNIWEGIEGVVIDAVGTLITPHPPVADVYRAAALRQGTTLDRDEIKTRFVRNFRNDEADEASGTKVTSEAIEAGRWQRIVTAVLPEVPNPDLAFGDLWSHFARPDAWACFPDVAPALRALRAVGLRVVVGSNFDGRLRGVVAGHAALAPLRESLVISSEVGYRKPHPKFYEACCERLNLPASKVLCVGDDLQNDVAGPLRSGLRSVLLDRKVIDPGEFWRCCRLDELTDRLRNSPGKSSIPPPHSGGPPRPTSI